MMGIVHHAVYPIWYEMARMDFWKQIGFSFEQSQEYGINPVVVDLHMQYKTPAKYPQELTITTRITEFAPRKIKLHYEVTNDAGELLSIADTFHIWTGPDSRAYSIEENLPEVYERIAAAVQ
jgi:Predicted thioesterase